MSSWDHNLMEALFWLIYAPEEATQYLSQVDAPWAGQALSLVEARNAKGAIKKALLLFERTRLRKGPHAALGVLAVVIWHSDSSLREICSDLDELSELRKIFDEINTQPGWQIAMMSSHIRWLYDAMFGRVLFETGRWEESVNRFCAAKRVLEEISLDFGSSPESKYRMKYTSNKLRVCQYIVDGLQQQGISESHILAEVEQAKAFLLFDCLSSKAIRNLEILEDELRGFRHDACNILKEIVDDKTAYISYFFSLSSIVVLTASRQGGKIKLRLRTIPADEVERVRNSIRLFWEIVEDWQEVYRLAYNSSGEVRDGKGPIVRIRQAFEKCGLDGSQIESAYYNSKVVEFSDKMIEFQSYMSRKAKGVLEQLCDALDFGRILTDFGGNIQRLIISPHGDLLNLCFPCLRNPKWEENWYLIDELEIIETPSLLIYDLVRQKTTTEIGSGIGLIHSTTFPLDSPHESWTIIPCDGALEKSLRECKKKGIGILIFWGHGIMDTIDPFQIGFQYCSADGCIKEITAHELLGIFGEYDLSNEVILLSCHLGKVAVLNGDLYGGMRFSFLTGRAANLISSFWILNESFAGEFLDEYLRHHTYLSASSAFAEAIRNLKKDKPDNLLHWATLSLDGVL